VTIAGGPILMSDTIECPTCGGSGIRGQYEHVDSGTGEHLGNQPIPCPDCANGRQPSPEVLERMAKALRRAHTRPSFLDLPARSYLGKATSEKLALAAWLAEHAEEQT